MTWQLGSIAILAVGLAGGFAWYERSRPDARIVALVATLAAFAALGRIAFATLPNVKPTTDIVLVSGYALGGAPGFVVGAVAGVTSNFFFGQGPWTPWQMAAWGVTGLIGAGLARVTGRRISRWPLALVCCVIGFLFTAIQDVGDWVTYSDHSLAQLATYVGTGLGFDAIDAGGCLMFALIFGPALLRSLQRFARRLQVTWLAPAAGVAPVALIVVGGLAIATAVPTPAARAADATSSGTASPLTYLLRAENANGGFGPASGQPSSALFSGWAALALAADGRNPADVRHDGGRSLLADIEATVGSDPGSIERTMLVAGAAGVSATDFGGHDLLAELDHDIRRNGSVGGQSDLTSFAVLALRAAGVDPPARMLRWLARQQDRDGGFSYATAGDSPDVDDTGSALQALAATDPAATRRAVRFIRRNQNRDGGFPSEPGSTSNAQSTAWAIQGLIAAGVDPWTVRTHGSPSPVQYLTGLITGSGAIDYARGVAQTPVWVTAEAVVALDGKPFPLAAVPARSAHPDRSSKRAGHSDHHHTTASSGRSHRRGSQRRRSRRRRRSATSRGGARTHHQPASAAGTAAHDPVRRTPRGAARRGGGSSLALVCVLAAACILAFGGGLVERRRRRRRVRQAS